MGLSALKGMVKTGRWLCNRRVPKNLNVAELGYCAPNGEIIFQSNQVAMKYAKNQAVLALRAEKPYEKAVVVKDNVIKGIYTGNCNNVDVPEAKIGWIDCTLVHGHPCGNTLAAPLSLTDAEFLFLKADTYNRMIAYNSAGEYSQLSKLQTGNVLFPTMDWQKIKVMSDCRSDFKNFVLGSEVVARARCAWENGNIELARKIIVEAQDCTKGLQKIHNFWKQNATKYGMEYTTNYSYLG